MYWISTFVKIFDSRSFQKWRVPSIFFSHPMLIVSSSWVLFLLIHLHARFFGGVLMFRFELCYQRKVYLSDVLKTCSGVHCNHLFLSFVWRLGTCLVSYYYQNWFEEKASVVHFHSTLHNHSQPWSSSSNCISTASWMKTQAVDFLLVKILCFGEHC